MSADSALLHGILGPAYLPLLTEGLPALGVEQDRSGEMWSECLILGPYTAFGPPGAPEEILVPVAYGPVRQYKRATGPWAVVNLRLNYSERVVRNRVAEVLFDEAWERNILESVIATDLEAATAQEEIARLRRLSELLWSHEDEGMACRAMAAAAWGPQ